MQSDRRQYPRILTEQSLQIIDDTGNALPAVAVDISLLGLQLICDRLTVRQLTEGRSKDGDGRIHIRLPILFGSADGGVEAFCRVVYLRQASDDECRLGLQYKEFVGRSYDSLEGYIDRELSEPEENRLRFGKR